MQDQNVSLQTYPVRLRSRGQITVPQSIRERFAVADGDFLVMVEVDGLVFLSPKTPQVARLADKLTDLMEGAGVTLADLLQGVADERTTLWKERNQG